MTKQLVRESSAAGPCLTLGLFTRRTAKCIFYREWKGGDRYAETESRVGGWKVETDFYHLEPCSCCRDHERTQYPHGYTD